MLPWPRVDCTSGSVAPRSIACDACACLSQCGLTGASMPAGVAARFSAVARGPRAPARGTRLRPSALANRTSSLGAASRYSCTPDLSSIGQLPYATVHALAALRALSIVGYVNTRSVRPSASTTRTWKLLQSLIGCFTISMCIGSALPCGTLLCSSPIHLRIPTPVARPLLRKIS